MKRLNFCPYCGRRLPESNKNKTNYCCFCGKKFQYKKDDLVKKVQCIVCHKFVDQNMHKTISCSYCGSMYHSTCVSSWLLKYNACPLCQNVFIFPNKIIPLKKQ
jgi:hypothetical protein